MSYWYSRVTEDPKNYQPLFDCLEHFENELEEARKEVRIEGSIEKIASQMPGIVEHRFRQYQEVEHILEYLNIQYYKTKNAAFRKYLEHYNRQLSSRDAEKFAEGDEEVYTLSLLVNRFALLRNQYQALHKGLETKQFQLNNITKLRTSGLEDAEIHYTLPKTK